MPHCSSRTPHPSASSGFTLVELIVILAIVAILAVYVSARFFSVGQYQARSYFDTVVAATRYAQKVALASGCPVQVSFRGNNYSLAQQTPPCTPSPCSVSGAYSPVTQAAAGVSANGAAPNGVTLTPGQFCFDGNGLVSDPSLGTTAFTVAGGGFSRSFTLNVPSGYLATP
ncbi:MAG: prepilin-type N-terminal cleavage/methylation domain-containing protein [Gammaproteobacteria bacterium]